MYVCMPICITTQHYKSFEVALLVTWWMYQKWVKDPHLTISNSGNPHCLYLDKTDVTIITEQCFALHPSSVVTLSTSVSAWVSPDCWGCGWGGENLFPVDLKKKIKNYPLTILYCFMKGLCIFKTLFARLRHVLSAANTNYCVGLPHRSEWLLLLLCGVRPGCKPAHNCNFKQDGESFSC